MDHPFIIGKKIYLRGTVLNDADMLATAENHPDPRETLFIALPASADKIRERLQVQLNDPHSILFTICRNSDNTPLGQSSLLRIDWVGRMAIFYIVIAEKINWSQGYGGEATRLMIHYAFDTLNLNRIQLHVATANDHAVKAYEGAGFKIEGTLREAMYHHGRYEDFYVMGILRSDRAKTF